jgi:hypothetical protein
MASISCSLTITTAGSSKSVLCLLNTQVQQKWQQQQ